MKCRKNRENRNLKLVKEDKERMMILSKCSVSDSKKSRFINEQEASGLLSSLEIKAPSSRIVLISPHLF